MSSNKSGINGYISPGIIGSGIKQATLSMNETSNYKILVVEEPTSPLKRNLYYIDKEDLMIGAVNDLDISEEIFSTPTYDYSYQDIIPNTWAGLPDLSLIGETYTDKWLIEYRKNPNKSETINGTQIATTYTGRKFIRYGVKNVWQRWQLMSGSIPFGAITTMLVPSNNRAGNNLGWIPLNGFSHNKKKYPQLFECIKEYVTSNDSSFTLPDLTNHYISVDNDKNIGKKIEWTLPDISDEIDFISGRLDKIKIIRTDAKRSGKLFQVERRDDTLTPYLSDDTLIYPNTGAPIEGDGSGLTQYLKIDLPEKIGSSHIGLKVSPDTFCTSNYYIYAGYPQID